MPRTPRFLIFAALPADDFDVEFVEVWEMVGAPW